MNSDTFDFPPKFDIIISFLNNNDKKALNLVISSNTFTYLDYILHLTEIRQCQLSED